MSKRKFVKMGVIFLAIVVIVNVFYAVWWLGCDRPWYVNYERLKAPEICIESYWPLNVSVW